MPSPRSALIGKAGLYLATFMAVFDIAVVYLALPDIERSIGASLADQQWIASAYGLMEASFTLAAGTLGDLYGRKRVYIFGVTIFILGSLASGLAPNPLDLIFARFVQGVGGAIAMALPLAILVSMCDGKAATERAIRSYATVAGLGAVAGPALGGVLVQTLGWRSVFFVNVPIAAFVLYAAFAHTAESERDPKRRLDGWGQLTSIVALLTFSFAAIEGNVLGWSSLPIIAAGVTALACALAFPFVERRASSPMLDFALLRKPLLAAGTWIMLLINIGFFTLYLISSLYIQDVRAVSPLVTGWYLLANNFLFFASNQWGGGVSRRIGERAAALLGLALGAAGLATFAFFRVDTPAAFVMIPLALCGLGWGIAYTPINDLAMGVVPKDEDGLASGLLSIGRPLGAVLGTAVFGSVLGAFMDASLRGRLTELHVSSDAALRLTSAIHAGGIWSVAGSAAEFGLALGVLRAAISAGFVTGMHVSGLVVAAASVGAVAYAAFAYRIGRADRLVESSGLDTAN